MKKVLRHKAKTVDTQPLVSVTKRSVCPNLPINTKKDISLESLSHTRDI